MSPSPRAMPKKHSAADRVLTGVLVGAGHRGILYAKYALKHPDELKIVGVADPNDLRRSEIVLAHKIDPQGCFRTAEALAAHPPIADAIINATMDRHHVPTSLPLLEAGYHLLLEKPIATTESDLLALRDAARRNGRIVMICHVLRYAPFYAEIRKQVADGQLGDIIAIETAEYVSYHHMTVGFVRGKWNRKDKCESSMLMAKCCHDLDLITWMKSGVPPRRVSSFGSLMHFRPENAPPGSGTRCLVDCRIEQSCPYSARKIYVDRKKWGFYAWEGIEHLGKDPTDEQKLQSLREDNPYGRCVWRCDNDVVDHQSVMVEFADGSTASHNMIGGAAKPAREIHLVGTKGEIQGRMEDGMFFVRYPDPSDKKMYCEQRVDVTVRGDMHGGGDMRLVGDFLRTLRGEPASISCTALEDSIHGAQIGFAADRSMNEHRPVEIC
jgi:predicted dehydrogenase